jgi:hypothetical protein
MLISTWSGPGLWSSGPIGEARAETPCGELKMHDVVLELAFLPRYTCYQLPWRKPLAYFLFLLLVLFVFTECQLFPFLEQYHTVQNRGSINEYNSFDKE